jgi:hypothetical protein
MKKDFPVFEVGVIALPVLFFLLVNNRLAISPGAEFSDLPLTHLTNATIVHDQVSQGFFPAWNPWILGGIPLAAHPLGGVWYPFGWLANLLPSIMTIQVLEGLHIGLLGWGVYELSKNMGASKWAGLVAAITTEFAMPLWAHLLAGHVTLIYAIAWTPWLVLCDIKRRSHNNSFAVIWEAIILGMIVLADIRWSAYTGIMLAGCWGYDFIAIIKKKEMWKILVKYIAEPAVAVSSTIGFTAAFLIPFFEYVPLTLRKFMSADDINYLSLPPLGLVKIFSLDNVGQPEWQLFLGYIPLYFIALASISHKDKSRNLLLAAILLYLLSMGFNWLPKTWILSIPGLSLLRVPARLSLLSTGILIYLSAFGFDQYADDREGTTIPKWLIISWLVLSLTGIGLSVTVGGSTWWQAVVFVVCCISFVGIEKLGWNNKVRQVAVVGLLGLSLATGLAGSIEIRKTNNESASALVESINKNEELPVRVFSPTFDLPQEATAGMLMQANGVDPMILNAYSHYIYTTLAPYQQKYSVTLPYVISSDPFIKTTRIDYEILGRLGVKHLVSKKLLLDKDLLFSTQSGEFLAYENLRAKEMAHIAAGSGSITGLQILDNGTYIVDSVGPAVIEFAQLFYPGWQAQIDNQEVDIQLTPEKFIRVTVPEGKHTVTLTFSSKSLHVGILISLITIGLTILFVVVKRRKHAVN